MMQLWEFSLISAIRALLFQKNRRIKYLCFVVHFIACWCQWVDQWPRISGIRFLRLSSDKFPLLINVSELFYNAAHGWSHSSPTDEFLEEMQYVYRHVVPPEKIQGNTPKVAQGLRSNRNACLMSFFCSAASTHLNRCLFLFLFFLFRFIVACLELLFLGWTSFQYDLYVLPLF